MSSLGLATPHALCPKCFRHNTLLLIQTQTLPSSFRCAGGGVGGRLLARNKDGDRYPHRRYHSSASRLDRPEDIVPESLTETLELHRTLNRQSLIRKVGIRGRPVPGVFRPDIPYLPRKKDAKQDTKQNAEEETVKELELARPETSLEEDTLTGDVNSGRPIYMSEEKVMGPVVRLLSNDPKKRKRRRKVSAGKHPFDPGSTYKTLWWAKREELCWKLKEGQPEQYPWMEHCASEKEQQHDGLSRLNAEIEAFEEFILPTSREREVSDQVISDIAALISKEVQTSLPVSIGSRVTGMSLAHSDIDLLIPIKDPERPEDGGRGPSPTRPKAVRIHMDVLREVERILIATGDFKHVVPTRARVPIVSAVHGRTGLELQFQCGDEGSGTPSSQEYTKNYQVEFPALRAIYVVLRMTLEKREIFGAKNGTIGAYGLTMMIVAALKLGDGTFHRRHDFGKQLIHVLQFYSEFDFKENGLAVEPPGVFNKKDSQKTNTQRPITTDVLEKEEDNLCDSNEAACLRGQRLISKTSMKQERSLGGNPICIQDPADYTNDLGRTCNGTRKVQSAFRDVLKDITEGVKKWDEDHENSDIDREGKRRDQEKPLLGFALGANYEDFELARDKVVYGSWFN